MQKHPLSLWLFALITCMQFGNTLAAEPTPAPFYVRCNPHKEMLKTDLSRSRIRQAKLAIFTDWKLMLLVEVLGMGLTSVARAALETIGSSSRTQWTEISLLQAQLICLFAMITGQVMSIAPIIGFIKYRLARWNSFYLEREIATIKG